MSHNLSGSDGQLDHGQQMQEDPFNIYGMYFCGACKNIMTPMKENTQVLEFKCKICDKKTVDFKQLQGDACIIYNKELKPGSKAAKAEKQMVMDPTLPRINIECPQCQHHVGFYIVTPDQFETAIDVKIICGNALFDRCVYTWTLPLEYRLEGNNIKFVD